MSYKLSFDFKKIEPFSQSYFTGNRDYLVREGKLNPPYTNTPEYMALLKSQVLYWNGKEFVKRNGLKQ